MPINRAAIVQQISTQLQQQLTDAAQVSLLQQPGSPEAKPQVVVKLGEEQVKPGQNQQAGLIRTLMLSIQSQPLPDSEANVLQALDLLAENIELALIEDDSPELWMNIVPTDSRFDFEPAAEGISATMTQQFELAYLVSREVVDTSPAVTQVYLSNQGGPYELVAEVPTS